MENYYEILQVSQNASKEIIDKAFKTLAKKYHPDANSPENKAFAEEQFKKINTAYEVISDKEKRKKYDDELKRINENKVKQQEQNYQRLYVKYQDLLKELNDIKSKQVNSTISKNNIPVNGINTNVNKSQNPNWQEELNRQVTQSVDKAYYDAYTQIMKDYGYKIHYKKSLKQKLKDILALFLTISLFCIIFIILWCIPVVREYIKSNEIYQFIIKLIFPII